MIPSSPRLQGQKAVNILRVASAGQGSQTVTIGGKVYELTTKDDLSVTAGRIAVDVHGGSTVKSQGKLTFSGGLPTAGETVVIGGKTYTFKAAIVGVDDVNGYVKIGADESETAANLAAAINRTPAYAGSTYAAATTKHTTVTADSDAGDCIITAIAGGTAGDAITLAESATHVAKDSTTLGTETAGVDPTADEVLDALEAAINDAEDDGTTELRIVAEKISTTHLLVSSKDVKVVTHACSETLAGANNGWSYTAMYGGAATKTHKMAVVSRVPTAVEDALDIMHFQLPFTPSKVLVFVAPTATPGAWKIWDGAAVIDGGHVTIDDSGSVDWAATNDTVTVIFIE